MKVARSARNAYQFDRTVFDEEGNLQFSSFQDAHLFVQKLNDKLDDPEDSVRASEINGLVLVTSIFEHLLNSFQTDTGQEITEELFIYLNERLGYENVDTTLRSFLEEFPPPVIYSEEQSVSQYLEDPLRTAQHRKHALNSLIVLWLSNENPVFATVFNLVNDTNLITDRIYPELIALTKTFYQTQPVVGTENQRMFEMLRSLGEREPTSIRNQLVYIRDHWNPLLGDFTEKLLQALDFIEEEYKYRGLGPGESQVYVYDSLDEKYSKDREWMPQTVMIAKNVLVWLHQLRQKYERDIYHLDQIPEEEFAQLQRWGATTLWLIGVWRRGSASKTIKQWTGNPEAEASAYSVSEYNVSHALGGHDALNRLRHRAWQYGIRLASDMVPNHTSVDSKWVIEHPDWFISLPYTPFPVYQYSGLSVSNDDRVGIFIEDHYFSRTDAAVVFKRVDNFTNDVRYIYHGNDGTSMPWNDTAQLNYLNPDVREAVIQTILHVARTFPIIRFDAAMTLTKKHIQRLWFPAPGTGGAIPSRAEHGISIEDFSKAIPTEFWREVVDRVAREVPNTLLIAEAFWLLEGFFVRTLGMHRVYNSAFMNMLRDEDNAKYRLVIKNTIGYDPEILKRFVNFMSNPDEETAAAQFGKGDKYFGICVLLATMPGLPMFGHGQVQGFEERYGMEYSRSYSQESADLGFIQHHEKIIFPLLHRRVLFAEVTHFRLYDCYRSDGFVDEDVFAYSNGYQKEKALIIYHNKHKHTSGWLKTSAAFMVKEGSEVLNQTTLGEALGLHPSEKFYMIFRDLIKNLDFLRKSRDIIDHGLFVELAPYQAQVLIDIRELEDATGILSSIKEELGGRGVPNIQQMIDDRTTASSERFG